ncbi:MAG TPA: vWA domain-containing protein [Polyangiaceae bacterium LLY-WYZ-14_1]|nr:vWA domain-containing protein [Polyangiaceae bacterium LLY-WYZ-14_1]
MAFTIDFRHVFAGAPWLRAQILGGVALFLIGALAAGCGAKTGLTVPDAGPINASDSGPDIGFPGDDDDDEDDDREEPICIDIPVDGSPILLPLESTARVRRADVLFLIDITQSMRDEITAIQQRLRDEVSPGISAAIPDTELGVAIFADFGVDPYGDSRDVPFELRLQMSGDLAAVQAALDGIELGAGKDEPESQVEALFQTATGQGLDPWVEPSFGCPSGGFGYPCFRDDAVPVVMLLTDAPFHNGPNGEFPYLSSIGRGEPPHTFAEAERALVERGIRVIGINSSGDRRPRRDLEAIAEGTGTLDRTGRPLVFDIDADGSGLGGRVIEAITTFANDLVQDVDLELRDPDPRDGVDVLSFIDRVRPLRAVPPDGVQEIDVEAGVFRGVRAGTEVIYELVLRNDAVVPGDEPRTFRVDAIFRGDERARLARRTVLLVVPAADGRGCEATVAGS